MLPPFLPTDTPDSSAPSDSSPATRKLPPAKPRRRRLRRWSLTAFFAAVALIGALAGDVGWAWCIFFGLMAILSVSDPSLFISS